ncbi:MAG: hypothetical protein EZS28_022799 [Streblomastix strix]|uniref:Uncharacterized protein n=1 Tax=Streblomastix strix TaxID=222440 RepID=A0A5J4VH67_9EUKA|nr:MAG: hypothetical protein EZS28_022799 [Streblomastix strix]
MSTSNQDLITPRRTDNIDPIFLGGQLGALSTKNGEERKTIIRNFITNCASSRETCQLFIREHITEKIITIAQQDDDIETKELCYFLLSGLGMMLGTEQAVGQYSLVSSLLNLAESDSQSASEAGVRELCKLLENSQKENNDQKEIIIGWALKNLHQYHKCSLTSQPSQQHPIQPVIPITPQYSTSPLSTSKLSTPLTTQSSNISNDSKKNKILGSIRIVTSAIKGGAQASELSDVYSVINDLCDDEDEDVSNAATVFIRTWKRRNLSIANQESSGFDKEKLILKEQLKKITEEKQQLEEQNKKTLQMLNDSELQKTKFEDQNKVLEIQLRAAAQGKKKVTEEKEKLEEQTKKFHSEQKIIEEAQKRAQEEKKAAEDLKKRIEEEKKKTDEERRRIEEEKKKIEDERRRIEDERRKSEERRKDIEQRNQMDSELESGQLDKSKDSDQGRDKQTSWKKIAATLSKKLEGNDQQIEKLVQKKDQLCEQIREMLFSKEDDDLRKKMISAGIVDGLLYILQSVPLQQITRSVILALYCLTTPCGNEVKLMVFARKPFLALSRIFQHTDPLIAADAITTLYNIILGGSNTTNDADHHPHFIEMANCGGIQKIFQLFKQTKQKDIKDTCAFCIGRLFKAKHIADVQMQREIIGHLKSLYNNPDEWTRNTVKGILTNLAQNQCMSNIYMDYYSITLT